ncbi:laminin-like protein epi-1 isoform X1 [Manduca sexta]|uniref:laminin-like protein epi-1 isoform X1 n=1 Tax=Manduca sexta TaxID=7130 RepID=UPI00188FF77B|nr:laminin-like protein epi-1 isoform X1 [Manduca sexta]
MAIHRLSVSWVGVALLLCSPQACSARTPEEETRDAMISLVHKMRSTESKLERHEFREKALGDLLKAKLSAIDKQHKAFEPMVGLIQRLDDRLSNVETVLLRVSLRDKDHDVSAQKKTNEALDRIQKTLDSLSTTIAENTKQTKKAMEIDNNLTLNEDSPLDRRLDITDSKIDALKLEIANLKYMLHKENLPAVCRDMSYDVNPLQKHITQAEILLSKFDSKLNKYNESAFTSVIPLSKASPADEAWQNKISEVMERQEVGIKKIHKQLNDAESIWKELPKRIELQTATNETLRAIANVTENIKDNAENSVTKIGTKLHEMNERFAATNKDIQQSLTISNTLTEKAFDTTIQFAALRTDIEALKNSEKVLVKAADDVIAMKKHLQYVVQEILNGVTAINAAQARVMNKTVHERFDSIEKTLTTSQKNALGDLSTKVELKMSQVWAQIGMMHQQLLLTKESLYNLTDETQHYANSSTKKINKVKEEVDDIKKSVDALGSNMNYALGKLALSTQEFDRITSGVADALASLKEDINRKPKVTVTTEDPGPGPHNATLAVEETKP